MSRCSFYHIYDETSTLETELKTDDQDGYHVNQFNRRQISFFVSCR